MRENIQCLLIDDDEDDQEIFLIGLGKLANKIDCTVLDNAIDAIKMLDVGSSYLPDVIFIDVNMPKMNGVECLKLLRQMPHLSESKIYMYSTTSETGTVKLTKELGADEFIVKPAKIAELTQKLSQIFHF